MSDEQDRYDREFNLIVFCEMVAPAIMARIRSIYNILKPDVDDKE